MANFKSGYILTNAGKALQAKVEAGETLLQLTKIKLGSGTVESIDEYADMTDLKEVEYEMIVASVESRIEGCVVKANVTSTAVSEGFNVTELGLFAKDGDDEILFCVSYDEDVMYVPGKSDGSAVTCEFSVYIQFAAAAKVEIVLPTDVDEIVKWVQNNTLICENSAEKSQQAITAADRAEQEALNAGNAAATAESARDSANSARDQAEAIAIEAKESAAEAKTSEENAATSAAKAEKAAQKLSNVFSYKGSVATYDDLPTDANARDVWNVQKADATQGINAGDNVAWTGEEWTVLGNTYDMSGYATTASPTFTGTVTASTLTVTNTLNIPGGEVWIA